MVCFRITRKIKQAGGLSNVKIGILQCDDVMPALEQEHGNYPAMFVALFSSANPACRFEIWRVIDGEIPEITSLCDGWLITGSRHSVYDDLPWLVPLKQFIQTLYADKRKLVGICFGHQLMADVLGGQVTLSEKGGESGCPVTGYWITSPGWYRLLISST